MKIDAYASLEHFTAHMAPIFLALPEEHRGTFYARGRAYKAAVNKGVVDAVDGVPDRRTEGLIIVAAYEDYRVCPKRQVIFVNHGVGQTYTGLNDKAAEHPSYSGGSGRERVVLFLEPNEFSAERTRQAYPNTQVAVVGCPKLDRFHLNPPPIPSSPVVAFTFHADIHICPETRWTLPYYQDAIKNLVESEKYDILGHGHPRFRNHMEKFWGRLGVPFEPDLDMVMEKASCLVFDNSSAGYEMASIGKPVVTLSAPWYRREVHHNLRFWSHIPGIHVEEPDKLAMGIEIALEDPSPYREIRERAVEFAYSGLCDGQAARRAVDAIVDLLDAS